jgi:hypothetical protein
MPQISIKKARRFPEIRKRLKRSGNSIDKTSRRVGATATRTPPNGAAVSRQNVQINTDSYPGVPALRRNGKRVIF